MNTENTYRHKNRLGSRLPHGWFVYVSLADPTSGIN